MVAFPAAVSLLAACGQVMLPSTGKKICWFPSLSYTTAAFIAPFLVILLAAVRFVGTGAKLVPTSSTHSLHIPITTASPSSTLFNTNETSSFNISSVTSPSFVTL